MISRNYSEKISFITFFPLFTNIFTNAPGLYIVVGGFSPQNAKGLLPVDYILGMVAARICTPS